MSDFHQHLFATCDLATDLTKEDARRVEQWFLALVDLIDMKVLVPPKVVWCETKGNEGLTGIVCIDTSHSSLHAWSGYFKFDLYSCKNFDMDKVKNHMKSLDVISIRYTIIDRTDDSQPIIIEQKEERI